MSGVVPYGRSNPCPQCGHGDAWCWASPDGRFTCCRRVQGDRAIVREDRNGQEYYVTRNDGGEAGQAPEPVPPSWRETIADAATRDRIFRALIDALSLSTQHLSALRARGLPGEAIERAAYRTLSWSDGERARAVWQVIQTARSLYLLNVPGFYKRHGSKDTRLGGNPGILVPARDDEGRILGMLIRVDETRDGGGKYRWLSAPAEAIGCGAGMHVHVPLHVPGPLEVVRITEGPLKADIATALSSVLTIGVPGVSAWKLALPVLKTLAPKRVLIAFDADARSKVHVARPLSRVARALRDEGFEVALEVWPEQVGKGIDDVLAAGNAAAIRVVGDDDLDAELAAIAESAGIAPRPSATPSQPPTAEERKSQAQALLALAAGLEFFHSPEGHLYADLDIDGHRETWLLGSAQFRQWLALRMYRTHGKPAGGQAMNDALGVLEARARFDGPERSVFLRVAHAGGSVYIDLANERWEAVEITPQGWRVVPNPPVRFRRTSGMRPLPRPVAGGSLEELRPFLNVESEDDWKLAIAWLVGAFRPKGPYPLAVLQGEQGSAKSTAARVLRSLVDPNTSLLRAKPRDVQELMIAAINSWVVSYDNLSGLSIELSDGLCRLATGGGFSTRELYTNSDETCWKHNARACSRASTRSARAPISRTDRSF